MKLLLLTLCLFPLIASAQLPEKDGKVFFEKIDSLPGSTKDQLYQKAKGWAVEAFTSVKDILQSEDNANGEFTGKGMFQFTNTVLISSKVVNCYFTFRVTVKDGKYRLQVYNIYMQTDPGVDYTAEEMNKRPGANKKLIAKVDNGVQSIISTFNAAMKKEKDNSF